MVTRDITDRLRTVIHTDWAKLHMGPGLWTRGDQENNGRYVGHARRAGAAVAASVNLTGEGTELESVSRRAIGGGRE